MTVEDAARILLPATAEDGRHLAVADIRRNYRALSKEHHPDAGGDPVYFRRLVEARDLLLSHAR